MFGDPDWMKWSLRGGEVGSEYKGPGQTRDDSPYQAQGYKWSQQGRLLNRETNESIKDPKQDC